MRMYCPNCGKEISAGASFCGECGTAIAAAAAPAPAATAVPVAQQPAPAAPVAEPAPAPAAPVAEPAPAAQPVEAQPQAQPQPQPQAQPKQPSDQIPFGQHFKNLIKAAINPVTGPAVIAPKYDKVGNGIFIAGIVVVLCSLAANITSVTVDLISLFRYPRVYDDIIGGMIARDIFYPYIVYAIRVFGCAGLMLLAGLIFKEKWSFPKLLSVAAMAVAPAYLVRELVCPFIGLIPYVGFSTLISSAAYIYYLFMLYEGMGEVTKLKDDKKLFILVVVFAITAYFASFFNY